jgi:hypothetical protein
MLVTANETIAVESGMDDSTTLQVPLLPVVHWPTLELDPFQLPRTATPLRRLCFQSCAVIVTVARQVLERLAEALRFPT